MAKSKYYAVWGVEGLCVMPTWNRVREARNVYSMSNCKCFSSFYVAAEYARKEFNLLRKSLNMPRYYGNIPLNHIHWVDEE